MTHSKSALVVMNNPSEVWAIARDLIGRGLSVTASVSGEDAFQQLEHRDFDYLVMDGAIRDANLLTFLAHCRKYLPGSVTIVLAEAVLGITPEKLQAAGAKYCVSGPKYREIITDIIFGLGAGKSPGEASQ